MVLNNDYVYPAETFKEDPEPPAKQINISEKLAEMFPKANLSEVSKVYLLRPFNFHSGLISNFFDTNGQSGSFLKLFFKKDKKVKKTNNSNLRTVEGFKETSNEDINLKANDVIDLSASEVSKGTLNPSSSTLNTSSSTLNPSSSTLNPISSTFNSKLDHTGSRNLTLSPSVHPFDGNLRTSG